RLNVIPIRIPPLRERPGDIVPLAEHFISKIALRENIREKTLEPAAKDALLKYPWPGNVREMENVMERAMILADTDTIPKDFIPDGGSAPAGTSMEPPAGITIQEMERRLIHATLKKVGGNRTKAASLLGISIRTLRNKLNEYTRDSQNSDDFPAEEDRAHP
ncbi:MAG TPA: helix-turn-helix domain-containing protein, partial [Deltaproteobacteria bacterium]|nr:helix-turn-helix domain-containing protein [Deltaproteobacteria bacterium]